MKEALEKMLASMKFWTTIIGMLVTAGGSLLAKYGFEVSDATVQQVAITISGLFGILLFGQAANDHGKAAAEKRQFTDMTAMAASTLAEPTVSIVAPHPDGATIALTNGQAHVVTAQQLAAVGFAPITAKNPESGRIRLDFLFFIAIGVFALASCSWFKKSDTAHEAVGSVINCVAPELGTVKKQFGALAEYAIIRSVGDDGTIDKAAIKDSFRDAGTKVGGCLLADAFNRLSKAALAALANGIKSEGVTITPVQANAVLADLYPGVTFKVE